MEGRIGILGCDTDSDAQLFINQLPGVSLQQIDALADDEQESFAGVWNDVVFRTMKKFQILVKAAINRCHRITDNEVISCLVCEKKDLFDVALWYLHGTELMIERTSTETLSRYTTIDLDVAERLKGEFYSEFEAALKDAVDCITPNDSDCTTSCVECNTNYQWRMQTP
ncbi:hypothetical protein JMG10_07560 [Nostoc ellipsosporum NOK]|nr:hypothetical protein [Nostoc ellipsosporum NOK]